MVRLEPLRENLPYAYGYAGRRFSFNCRKLLRSANARASTSRPSVRNENATVSRFNQLKLLVFNPGSEGGIVNYAWHQAEALGRSGNRVVVLCDRGCEKASSAFTSEGVLSGEQRRGRQKHRLWRILFLARQCVGDQFALFFAVMRHRPDAVLLASYVEYLSPMWVWLQFAASRIFGATFVAVLHDPVRNFVLGPVWWHKLSVSMAYWPLSAVFAHEDPPPEAEIPKCMAIYQVPHGLFPVGDAKRSWEDMRGEWGVPEGAVVFLSFGFIRDSKNLDLLIRALPENPAAHLIIVGRVQSESLNKPVSFYKQLARDLGVEQRLKVFVGFVPDEAVADYLQAADAIALTYSASFRSQSGVLNSASQVARPLLVSSGPGPLKECVEKFGLGEFVPPDDPQAISLGMARLITFIEARRRKTSLPNDSPQMNWEGYRDYASWDNNARIVVGAIAAARKAGAVA